MDKYFNNNPNTLVIINNNKYNDFYSYCQGLHHIGRKETKIEINRTNNFLISFLFFDLHNRYLGDISALFILRLYDDILDNRFFSAEVGLLDTFLVIKTKGDYLRLIKYNPTNIKQTV